MAAKLEVIIFYNEENNGCDIAWNSFNSADYCSVEKSTLEQLKTALMSQLESCTPNGQFH